MKTDLSSYNNSWYRPGSKLKIGLWYMTNVIFFRSALVPFSAFKRGLLRLFGSKIGKSVVIKPRVNIKYPWFLSIGENTWIGEDVWIDNLAMVTIGNNVCLSQGSMLLCGSHDYKKSSFDLIVKEIILEDGVWIGAQAIVAAGVRCQSHSVLALNSVANRSMDPYYIYQGNPAKAIKVRTITE